MRPIGTQFIVKYDHEDGSTSSRISHTITYEVVAHKRIIRFKGDVVGKLVEEVKAIRSSKK